VDGSLFEGSRLLVQVELKAIFRCVDDYLPSSIKVAAVMMHDLALELIAQGHEVTVCTPDHTLKKPFFIEELDGVQVMRFKVPDRGSVNPTPSGG